MIQWLKNWHYTRKQPWTLKFEIKQQGECWENSEALNIDIQDWTRTCDYKFWRTYKLQENYKNKILNQNLELTIKNLSI
jgi:hypothetical protein